MTLSAMFLPACLRKSPHTSCPEPEASYRIRKGGSVSFCLVSNPSTGYTWEWANREAVRCVGAGDRSYRPDRPGVPGSGGCETWTFSGLRRGADSLRMVYRRSWEPDSVQQSRVIRIRVD